MQAYKNDLVIDFLYRHLGTDSDVIEKSFYAINPHVKSIFFESDTQVKLPEITHATNRKPKSLWN